MKILVATDLSEGARVAVDEIGGRAWPPGTRIALVASSRDQATAARRVLEDGGLAIDAETVDAAPHRRLVDLSETWGADLAVLGGEPPDALEAAELAGCTVESIRARTGDPLCERRERPTFSPTGPFA